MVAVTEVSQLLQEPPVTTGAPINAIFSFAIVEDPPGSGLYILPSGVTEDPPGSGLFQFAGLALVDAGGGLFMVDFDWVLHVERMVGDAEGAVWDLSEWATGEGDTNPDAWVWAELGWETLNDVVRGIAWTRGADQPNGRPRNGEITLTLLNTTAGENDPWVNYGNVRPGTVLRAGLTSATDTRADGWIPLWTGLVESWSPRYEGARSSGYRADSYAEVRCIETLAWLARIDGNALGSPAGSGEVMLTRTDRLLTAAEWPYGLVTMPDPQGLPAVALQSTDMAANRLTELYLTADSSFTTTGFGGGGIVRSDVTGAALVTTRSAWRITRLTDFSSAFGATLATVAFGDEDDTGADTLEIGYDPDSVETVNDPEGIVNDHRYTRVGGTQQLVPHPVSIGQFGRSTRARGDLIMTTDGNALAAAELDNDREARTALRVDAVTIVATGRYTTLLAVAAIDVGDNVLFTPPNGSAYTGIGNARVRSMSHTITPMKGAVHWTVTYALDFVGFTNLPGAILPEA